MKKTICTIMALLLMVMFLATPTLAAQGKVSLNAPKTCVAGATIEVTVQLQGVAKADALGIAFAAGQGLKIQKAEWILDGTIQDVNLNKGQAVWTSAEAVNMNSATNVLKLTVKADTLGGAKEKNRTVSVEVTATLNGAAVGSFSGQAGVKVTCKHNAVADKAVEATCTKTGLTAGSHCSICGTVLQAQKPTALKAHTYSYEYDESCDKCGAIRDVSIQTTPMYRLYNPNSGEHFYTGSVEERDMLKNAGWDYEGVAWNAPIYVGEPVHRLYNPNSGDHHYTMSCEEVEMLVDLGWIYEGVAWNSAPANHPLKMMMLRLYNPNADCGSHHYTGSEEERDMLVGVGWIFEGPGWLGLIR